MPKNKVNKKTKVHCQMCGKLRFPLQFVAINTEQTDKKNNIFPFKIKRFLELIQGETMIKLPKYYAATCSICYGITFFQGQNRGTKLEVIPT